MDTYVNTGSNLDIIQNKTHKMTRCKPSLSITSLISHMFTHAYIRWALESVILCYYYLYMTEGVEKGHNGPREEGEGERRATPERAGTKGEKNKERKGRETLQNTEVGWRISQWEDRVSGAGWGWGTAGEVRLPCRRFVADISFPNLKVGTCGAASHTYRGTWYGHFKVSRTQQPKIKRQGWGVRETGRGGGGNEVKQSRTKMKNNLKKKNKEKETEICVI